jgi:hypothetical protein
MHGWRFVLRPPRGGRGACEAWPRAVAAILACAVVGGLGLLAHRPRQVWGQTRPATGRVRWVPSYSAQGPWQPVEVPVPSSEPSRRWAGRFIATSYPTQQAQPAPAEQASGGGPTAPMHDVPAPSHPGSEPVWRTYTLGPWLQRLKRDEERELLLWWLRYATGSSHWQSVPGAVAFLDREQLIVKQTPAMQERVAAAVQRLVQPSQKELIVHLEVLEGVDPGWRRGVIRRLKPSSTGASGERCWVFSTAEANLVRTELGGQRRQPRRLLSGRYRLEHGVPAFFDASVPVPLVAWVQPTYVAGLAAYQPQFETLQQGVSLWLLPVWREDGASVELLARIRVRSVRQIQDVNTAVPLPDGSQPVTIQVPEVQTTDWMTLVLVRPGRTLVMSAGLQGSLSTPPTSSTLWLPFVRGAEELLVLADVSAPAAMVDRSAATP